MNQEQTLILIPKEAWASVIAAQKDILEQLKEIKGRKPAAVAPAKYITALEFMAAVRIKRTKFDQLVQTSRIKIIKKKRKIYVPVGEVERYFLDEKIP